jgi:hypothetical protein
MSFLLAIVGILILVSALYYTTQIMSYLRNLLRIHESSVHTPRQWNEDDPVFMRHVARRAKKFEDHRED